MLPSPADFNNLTHDWLSSLAASGHRVTEKNRAIITAILSSDRALDAVSIFETVRGQHPGLGLVTVYRTLQKLEELGLVDRLHQPGGCNRFLRATQGHEHLLVCSCCGRVVYFGGDDLDRLSEQLGRSSGFDIQSHWLQLFGLCPVCRSSGGQE